MLAEANCPLWAYSVEKVDVEHDTLRFAETDFNKRQQVNFCFLKTYNLKLLSN